MPVREDPWPHGTPSLLTITSPSPRALAEAYANVFGWALEGADGAVVARVLDRPVAVVLPGDAETQWTTHLAADDVWVATATARVAGATMGDPQQVGGGMLSRGVDPAGAGVGFWTPQDPSSAVGELGTLVWSELLVRDLDAARTFYDVVLDAGVRDGDEEYATFHTRDGELVARVGVMSDPAHDAVPPHWLPFLDVTALADEGSGGADEAFALATVYGFTPVDEPVDADFGRLALVRGPQGEAVALLELADEQADDAAGPGGATS